MSINVYWACIEDEWMRAEEPKPIWEKIQKSSLSVNSGLRFCPVVKDYMKNTYSISSLYDYEFSVVGEKVSSEMYDQEFFDRHVKIRSISEKLFSFNQWFIFFTDKDSLNLEITSAYFEDNNVTERCIVVPGILDIGKLFREIDFAFALKKKFNKFKIDEGEIFYYLKFHTNEKINFIQFRHSEGLVKHLSDVHKRNKYSKLKPLQFYYDVFNTKKLILKEIKNNLI